MIIVQTSFFYLFIDSLFLCVHVKPSMFQLVNHKAEFCRSAALLNPVLLFPRAWLFENQLTLIHD